MIRFFVHAGIALFERQTYYVSKALDAVQEKYFPHHQPIPFHASEIRSGKNVWRKVSDDTRANVLQDISNVILASPGRERALYAAAVEKSDTLYGEDAVKRATEEICRRFDIFLQRRFHEDEDRQRGLIVFSEGRFDAHAKVWVRGFHQRGTQWGAINNLADIPYFAPMQESRLLQAADFVAHAVWLLYEKKDPRWIGPLLRCFSWANGVPHGLVHVRPDTSTPCECPACSSRRIAGNLGPWLE